jgi:Tol biopolymer transport system component
MMDARWSPDGQWLAYEEGRDLYLAREDASEPRRLVTVPGDFDGWTAWSPDGSRLRFTVSDPTTYAYSLWEVAADATNLHPLLPGWNNPAAEGAGKWTSDGKYFLFEATRNGRTDIWAISEKGSLFQKASSEPVQLTAGPISFHHPVSSKDGRKVFAIGQMDRSEILRLNNAGEWVPYLSGISADGVSFSRDGNWVTYTLYPQGTLWRSKVDGSQRQQLTFPPMQANHPTWSPDGKRIAFMASVSRSFWNIYLVSAEGGTPQRLIPEDLIQADPDWSPDGTRLAFGASPYIYAGQPSVSQVIHVLDLRTNQVSTLPGSDGLWFPRWSPDGRYIAAIGRDLHQLMLFDITTGRSVELARNIYHFPHWSPDGQYVHIETWGEETRDATGATGPNPKPAMIRIRISDHKVERLVNLKPFRRLSDPRCWSGIAPDGSYLVLRNLRTQEIYSFDLK